MKRAARRAETLLRRRAAYTRPTQAAGAALLASTAACTHHGVHVDRLLLGLIFSQSSFYIFLSVLLSFSSSGVPLFSLPVHTPCTLHAPESTSWTASTWTRTAGFRQ